MKHTALPFVLSLTIPLSAQIPLQPKLGPFSTTGLGFALPGLSNELRHYRADTSSVAEFTALYTPPNTLFSTESLFAAEISANAALAGLFEIDAISSGNDVVPVTYDPATNVRRINPRRAPLGWAAMFFSLRLGTVSPTGPQPMASRRVAGFAGGDVFSWILPGSEPLGAFNDQIYLDVPAPTLGIGAGHELIALDIPMAVLAQNGGVPDSLFAPQVTRIFFSLTKASAAAVAVELDDPLNTALPNVEPEDMSGATVFTSTWNGSAWGPIVVARLPWELDLANGPGTADDEELDALAVNLGEDLFVYSVEAPSQRPQLMAWRSTFPAGELVLVNQDPVPTRIGDSDIDSICGIDPEMGLFSRWVGTPIAPQAPGLILSATQVLDLPNQHDIVFDVNGEPGTDATPPAGPMLLQVCFGPNDEANPWITFWTTPPWNGTGTHRVVLPVTFSLGVPVLFRAVLLPAGQPPVESSLIGSIL